MKASLFLAATGAALAVAGPIAGLEKRAMETDWVVEMVTVTVTEGNIAAAPTTIEPPQQKVKKPTVKRPKQAKKPKPEPVFTTIQPEPVPEPVPEPTQAPSRDPPKQDPPKQENPSSGAGSYADLMLKHHNMHRANHSAPALTWDSNLASAAATLGNTCVFDHNTDIGGGSYGQNLASAGQTGDISALKNTKAAQAISDQWYNGEFAAFAPLYGKKDPAAVSNLLEWGHFSDMLWKSTKKVGCATIKCPSGTVAQGMDSWYTVCNYSPPGNVKGAYADNVAKPKGAGILTI